MKEMLSLDANATDGSNAGLGVAEKAGKVDTRC